ncbi:hypothetical protein UNSWDHB_1464 [Dehalobacter sp. UNSWDHB]|nr:hypothetical protein UNSWDHB_1464 [Dehalobacter sp. UNSWDHB]
MRLPAKEMGLSLDQQSSAIICAEIKPSDQSACHGSAKSGARIA